MMKKKKKKCKKIPYAKAETCAATNGYRNKNQPTHSCCIRRRCRWRHLILDPTFSYYQFYNRIKRLNSCIRAENDEKTNCLFFPSDCEEQWQLTVTFEWYHNVSIVRNKRKLHVFFSLYRMNASIFNNNNNNSIAGEHLWSFGWQQIQI